MTTIEFSAKCERKTGADLPYLEVPVDTQFASASRPLTPLHAHVLIKRRFADV